MSDQETTKLPIDNLRDVLSQLKEIRHYAQSNIEKLSAQWLSFDQGEYKNPSFAKAISELLNKQSDCLDSVESAISDIEIEANRLENEG